MPKAVLEQLQRRPDLPSPTGIALRVLELARDETSTVEQLARTVELDPALSAKVLRIVNSPLAGAVRHVASVSHAASLLGVRALANLALSFSLISEHRAGRCRSFNYERFWSTAIARAVAARHVVFRVKSFPPDEAFCCALLSDVGRLALATLFPDEYAAALESAPDPSPEELRESERRFARVDHVELSAAMLEMWHFPRVYCDAVRGNASGPASEPPCTRSRLFAGVLRFADQVADLMTTPARCPRSGGSVVLAANALGIFPDAFPPVFDAIAEEWRETGRVLTVATHAVPPFAEILREAAERREELSRTLTPPTDPEETATVERPGSPRAGQRIQHAR